MKIWEYKRLQKVLDILEKFSKSKENYTGIKLTYYESKKAVYIQEGEASYSLRMPEDLKYRGISVTPHFLPVLDKLATEYLSIRLRLNTKFKFRNIEVTLLNVFRQFSMKRPGGSVEFSNATGDIFFISSVEFMLYYEALGI